MIARSEQRDQLSSQVITSLQLRTFTKRKKPSALIRQLATKPSATAEGVALGIRSHDLVDPLAAEPEVVGYLGQGLSTEPSLSDLRIPSLLPARTGLKRPPLPAREHLKAPTAIGREVTLPVTLPGVVDPVAQPKILVAEVLDMRCRDCAVTLSDSKLVERTDVLEELFRVVHTSRIVGEVLRSQPLSAEASRGTQNS